ncbi:MAG: polyphosphate polymerase domain-containing protein [Oscillospiraceae bacterium]|jgi:hypothetical protein|nr:polyphosphate polymerase domain-containing protein [Oscillospiraceae bacterium]
MNGRHELKYCVNGADCAQLRARLRAVAKPDGHAGVDGAYTVRSLYFDNYSDKAVTDKLSGQSRREKFRLRYYGGDTGFIRLEKKSKANRLCFKESADISAKECEELLSGNLGVLNRPDIPLFMELYTKMRAQNLRARSIVEYRREAYVFRAGNVRVTFDSGIKTSQSVSGFLDPGLAMIPAASATVLEVKYDAFLPDIIRDTVKIGWRNQTEFSKYVAARMA